MTNELPTGYRIEIEVSRPANRGRRTRRPIATGALVAPTGEALMHCRADLADEWDRDSEVTIPEATRTQVADIARKHAASRAEAAADPATEEQVSTIMDLVAPYVATGEPLAIRGPSTLAEARSLSRTEASECITYLREGS